MYNGVNSEIVIKKIIMNKIILFISRFINLDSYERYRKIKGGYWEKWYIDCIHCELWFERTLNQIQNKERPGCAFGQPTVEYYDLEYYGILRNDFDIKKLIRIKKIKTINEKRN